MKQNNYWNSPEIRIKTSSLLNIDYFVNLNSNVKKSKIKVEK